tara:strand:+ start:604 stop:897 length:294 start_codon:yes stop_codon:yes gene_type:complete
MKDFSGWKYTSADNDVIISPDGRSSISIADSEVAEWLDDGNTPASYVAPIKPYKARRADEYNLKSMGEQFGMQYDDAKNSTTTWVDWQTEIKVRIPE